MKSALRTIGVLSVIIGVIGGLILGAQTESFFVTISTIIGSVINSLLYFAVAEILEQLESIISMIYGMNYPKKSLLTPSGEIQSVKSCETCGKKVELDRSSCPYCGGRQFND